MGHKSNKELMARVAALPRPGNTWPRWVVTGGGLGFLRPAPGSWGTCGPAVVYWAMLHFGVAEPVRSIVMLAGAVVAGALLVHFGVWACAYFQKPDPGQVVIDEFAGFWVAAAFVPVPVAVGTGWGRTFLMTGGLYVLFRLTDTLKIPPARQLENLPYGWGILLDDIAAGLQANLVAQVVVRVWLM